MWMQATEINIRNDYPTMPVKHIVSVSSGAPSALLALKVVERYGKENVICLFADTLVEDADNYRFLYDLRQRGLDIEYVCDGRTPEDLQREQSTLFTQFLAPCTRILKLEPIRNFVQWLQSCGYLVHMHIGYTLEDSKPRSDKPDGRQTDTKAAWLQNGVLARFMLVEEKYSKQRVFNELKMHGLKIPRAYSSDFGKLSNANCGGQGGCVKGGKSYMQKMLVFNPVGYARREKLEAEIRYTQYKKQRNRGVRVADVKLYAQLRDTTRPSGHITLKTFREQYEAAEANNKQLQMFTLDNDMSGLCGAECGVSLPSKWSNQAQEIA